MKRTSLSLILAGFSCSAAHSQHVKLSPDLQNADADSNVRVIVQWKTSPDDAKDEKVVSRGGTVHNRLRVVQAGVYTLTGSAVRDLANDPEVAYITPDRALGAKLDNAAAAVNAAAAWNAGWTGNGIGIAVLDSGINDDPNLGARRMFHGFDFAGTLMPDSVRGAGVTGDRYGHGQHIAGIIASNGRSSLCGSCTRLFKGIAPGVNLIDLRVLDQNGNGTDSNVILAIETAIALKNTYNIRVMNLSLGRPVYESYKQDPLCQAVEAAWKAGIAVVAAAGNDGRDNTLGEQGYGTISAPGNDPYVITVGAMKTEGTYTRSDDLIASYSSKGPTQIDHVVKPDVVAPGNQVVSLLAHGSTLSNENPGNVVPFSYYESGSSRSHVVQELPTYFILSGTSMATAVVSAAVADLFEANPNLTPDQVKALIMQTAYKIFPASSTVSDSTGTYTDYYDIFTIGAGYLDMAAALAGINSVPAGGTAMSPIANYQAETGIVTLSSDPSSLWSNAAIWGAQSTWGVQSVWGAAVLSGNRCIWGNAAIWGASGPSSSQSIWGDQSIWGAQSVWGAQSIWGASLAITGEQ